MDVKDIHNSNVSTHNQTGLRFMFMKISLDILEYTYSIKDCYDSNMKEENIPLNTLIMERSFLRLHLKFWIYNITKNSTISYCKPRYGLCHVIDKPRQNEDGRRELPTSIFNALKNINAPWKSRKVTLTWIQCYLNDKLPNVQNPNWDTFQCSHLCLGGGQNLICLNGNHLTWESASDNQSRGANALGRRICTIKCNCGYAYHTVHIICSCNHIHDPPCCEPFI